jgi:putative DNA primase/helicase
MHIGQRLAACPACIATPSKIQGTFMSTSATVWDAVDAAINSNNTVLLDQASQLKILPIRWLWPGWLARGKLHVLAGTPGTGKTTIAMAIAATVSAGGIFPCGSQCSSGNVLIWTGEDDPADTLTPRLLASGANLNRVYFINNTIENGQTRSFDPAYDFQSLLQSAERIGEIKLLVVDPIVSAVVGDSHKANDVRRGLQPLVELAIALNCVVLGITHFSKGSMGRDPIERVMGSQAFGALARVVIVAAKDSSNDEGSPSRRFIARAKSNIGPDGGGFDYAMDQIDLAEHPGVNATVIKWRGAINGSARDLLGAVEAENNDTSDKTERDDAKAFLVSILSDGAVPVKIIKNDAQGAGYSWRTIERAKKEAGIQAKKTGVKDGWSWELPSE